MSHSSSDISRDSGLVLGLLLSGPAQGWLRRPEQPELTADSYIAEAQQAEAAKIHTLFLADGVASSPTSVSLGLEPSTLLSALAVVTNRIGLIGSISTSFFEPYNVARQIASLDHISRGRAGWNLVTSANGGENFGRDDLAHDDRYEVATEFAGLVSALWESWDEDAIVADRERRLLIDPAKVHTIDWQSKHFTVRGPLNIPRSPQGRPILAQAGSSEAGKQLGAAVADLIFTTGLDSVAESIEFADDYRRRIRAAGRDSHAVKILPGVAPVIGSSDEEAHRIWHEAHEDIDFERAREALAGQFGGIDFAELELDEVIPLHLLPAESAVQGRRSRYGVLRKLIHDGQLRTVRDLILYHASGAGHWYPVGSVERIADLLQERWERGAADGFNILPFYNQYEGGLDVITQQLIPELQRRGIFHTEYEHDTLRANLGLLEPALVG